MMKKISLLLSFVLIGIMLHAQSVDVVITFTDGTSDKIFQLENTQESMDKLTHKVLKKYIKKESINEIIIYYELEEVAIVLAGGESFPFLATYNDNDFIEDKHLEKCLEWIFIKLNN